MEPSRGDSTLLGTVSDWGGQETRESTWERRMAVLAARAFGVGTNSMTAEERKLESVMGHEVNRNLQKEARGG